MTTDKPRTKSKTVLAQAMADRTGLTKKQCLLFFAEQANLVYTELQTVGVVTIPGVAKVFVQQKPAKPERIGKNPKTGEAINLPAKPAFKIVKVRPVKGTKDAIV